MNQKTLADAIVDKMLMYQHPSELWINDELSFTILEKAKTVTQKNNQTVFEHTMKVLDQLAIKNHITLWSSLFHDMGKMQTKMIEKEKITFHGHENISAIIARNMLSAWDEHLFIIDRVERIIKTHMIDLENIGQKAIRNFVGNVGKDNIDNWFIVRKADASAYPHIITYVEKYIEPFALKVEKYRLTLLKEDVFDISMSEDNIKISGGK